MDLFSGVGGASCGFHAHPRFRLVAAFDAEIGKPSTGTGALDCNATYRANLGLSPTAADLATLSPAALAGQVRTAAGGAEVTVLIACPPCTGFSRTLATNHQTDDPRNSLVVRVADYAAALRPAVVVMENARELLSGRFSGHAREFAGRMREQGYEVRGAVDMLTRFGLPQYRERAVVVAARTPLVPRMLADLWAGWRVRAEATTVRQAISHLPAVATGATHPTDLAHTSTALAGGPNLARLQATPPDGGSWIDLAARPDADRLLIPAMKRSLAQGNPNHFGDVYGRMWWDRPAPTIKRESSHVGNGRYAHPEQDRLCTVREMAVLQGFPAGYRFVARSRKNRYRGFGDAVPPLISHQLAHLCQWVLTGVRPAVPEVILPGTHLTPADVLPAVADDLFAHLPSVA